MVPNGPLRHLNSSLQYYLVGGYIWALGMSILTLPIDYFYRYLLVCRDVHISLKQMFVLTLMAYGMGAWNAVWLTLGYAKTDADQYTNLLDDPMWYENGVQKHFLAVPFVR